MDVAEHLSENEAQAGRDARRWLLGFALVVATLLAFHPAWTAGFIWDDDKYVTQNPMLTAPDGLRRIWFSLDAPSQYFPLTYTSFYLERPLWGLHPEGYHRINVLLHAANALLVWALLARLGIPGAWLAAAIFALHPVQVESVAWVTERKNLLMGFFFLLALLAWRRFVEEDTRRPWRFYAVALICQALALAAKTTACTLPAALLLMLWLKKAPISWRRIAQVVPFVALGVGMGLVTVWWEQNKMGTSSRAFEIPPLERLLIASRALWFYAGKLIWPTDLTFSYPRWIISTTDPSAYVWLLATVAAVAIIWRTRKYFGRSVEVAAMFFAATLSPILGFVMMATFLYSFVADHYQYLACIGPIALAAAGMQMGLGRIALRKPFLQPVLCGGLLLVLGALTWRQCGTYASEETLWRTTLERNPRSWMAANNLALILAREGKREDAILLFAESLSINPNNEKAINNLANTLAMDGRVPEAIAQFRKALKMNPRDADAHNNLGQILAMNGEVAEAIAQFHEAAIIQPDDFAILNNLAWWLATAHNATLRNGAEAVALAQKANVLTGGRNPRILLTLAAAFAEAGRYDEACDTARLAEQRATEQNNQGLARMLEQEIHLYKARIPLHQD